MANSLEGRCASIPGQLEIANAVMRAGKADRSFPIGKTGPHPRLCIERLAPDRERPRGDRDLPLHRQLAPGHLSRRLWNHPDIGTHDHLRVACGADPVAEWI